MSSAARKAFVNFNEALLRSGLHAMLPRDRVVLEILESVQMSSELDNLCRALRGEGYTIALDDFTAAPELEPLTEIAQVIRWTCMLFRKPNSFECSQPISVVESQ
jgi:EAL and modified HD-GYP domain-containing signal transduction protein